MRSYAGVALDKLTFAQLAVIRYGVARGAVLTGVRALGVDADAVAAGRQRPALVDIWVKHEIEQQC